MNQPPYGQEPYAQPGSSPTYGEQRPPQPTYPPPPQPPTYPPVYAGPPSTPYGPPAGAYPPPPQPAYPPPVVMPYVVPMMPMPMVVAVPVARPADPGSGAAVTALVCGIVGLVFAVFTFCGGYFVSAPLGVIATIMGALGRRSTTHHGQATAGLVMGIITLALTIGIAILVYAALSSVSTIPSTFPTATPF